MAARGIVVVARIASEPVSTALTVADHRPRSFDLSTPEAEQLPERDVQPSTPPPAIANPLPPPEPAPAIAFAAALVAGRLPPEPISPLEIRRRLTGAWAPPASDLHLTNRRV